MNGIVLNHVIISNGQEIPICHMISIEFGVGNSKFVYVFQLKSTKASDEEPQAKKPRPLASRNGPSLKDSPEAFQSWYQSKKSLEQTLIEKNTIIDGKLERQKNLKDKLLLEKQEVNDYSENVKRQMEEKFNEEKKLLD